MARRSGDAPEPEPPKPWCVAAGGAAGGGRLKTYQPLLVRELVTSGGPGPSEPGLVEAGEDSPGTAAFNAWEARKAVQRAALQAKARAKEERFHAAMERQSVEAAARRDREFEETLAEVLAGIAGSEGITAETQAVVDDAGRSYAERQAALYQEWHAQVFETIQSRIREGVSRLTVAELEAQLHEAAASYVRATNDKPYGVYLDMVLPEQYDPLAPRACAVKITTGDIVDPVKRDLVKAQAERDLLRVSVAAGGGVGSGSGGGGAAGRSGAGGGAGARAAAPGRLAAAQTKEMLTTTKWGALQIRATPACHCITSDGLYQVKPPAPAALAMGASRVALDDFAPPAAAAYRPSKRMGAGEARRDHIDGIVKMEGLHAGGGAGGYSGGDAWLEAEGKRFVQAPGGEGARGRPF